MTAAPPDARFEAQRWGTAPSSLPTLRYELRLEGCAPHEAVQPSAAAAAAAAGPALTPPAVGALDVPSGLARLRPVARLGGGGAASTGRDLRSGNPREVNVVEVGAPIAAGGAVLRGVSCSYRYLCGYSTDGGTPGPGFALLRPHVAGAGAGAGAGDGDGPVVLWRSEEHPALPYSYDAATGGSPTNYSPPIEVAVPLRVGPLRGVRQQLAIRFSNGRRNLHLQGAAGDGCELGIQLWFGTEPPPAPAPAAAAAGGAPASDEALAFLSDALPAIDVAVLRESLEQAGGRAEAVLELFAA